MLENRLYQLRDAKPEDAGDFIQIYSPYILESSVSFETNVPTLDEMKSRIAEYRRFGFLTAVSPKLGVVGFAYATPHRTRAAYRWCCESSVYVDRRTRRMGVAQALYKALFKILETKNILNVYAGITVPNPESVLFHESMGFEKIAHYPKIGFKHGEWHDVGWWALRLGDPSLKSPAEPKLFP